MTATPVETRLPATRRARRPRFLWHVTALLTVCAAVGCTSGEVQAEGSDLDYYRDALADLWDGTDARAVAIAAEEAVAGCMTEAGFEYWPEVPAVPTPGGQVESGPDELDESWIATNGYGVSTGSEQVEQLDPSTVSRNQEYSGSLGLAESQAYAEALFGDSATLAEPAAGGADHPGAQGCMATGYASVSPAMTTPAVDELFEELNRAYEALDDVPEVAAVDAEWSQCMVDAGFGGLARPGDAQASIEAELGSLQSMVQVSDGVFRLSSDEDGLAELQRREVALATADHACRRDVDHAARVAQAWVQIENDFVALHKDELDAWLLWYQEQLA